MADELNICPECRAGKHSNCDGTAWDNSKDMLTTCDCKTLASGEHLRS